MDCSWVIDAGKSNDETLWFCPFRGGYAYINLSVPSDKIPNGDLIGIYHIDGDEAANNWYHKHVGIIESYIHEAQMSGQKFVKPDYISA